MLLRKDRIYTKRGRASLEKRERILIVDDSALNREILGGILTDQYEYIEAENGVQALDILRNDADIDLMLLDITMPEMDGFGVMEAMKRYHWIEDIPVIVISAESTSTFAARAYDLGAIDYISRPFDAAVVQRRVQNTLMLYSRQKRLIQTVEQQVYEREKTGDLMINILSHVVEFRNSESGAHVLRIRIITDILLRELLKRTDRYAFTESDISMIATASALHDIGKINIPEQILNKPGKLTKEEFDIMKRHTTIGDALLQEMPVQQSEPLMKVAREICRWHHERWDGRGYPDGLKGDEIPISAQVVSIADVYDALTSERCYKPAYSHTDAIRMIQNGECGAFNPLMLECLADAADRIRTRLSKDADRYDYQQEAQRLTTELLTQKSLPSGRAQQILQTEQDKTAFFSACCGGIQFEHDRINASLTITNWNEAPQNRTQVYHVTGAEQFPAIMTRKELQHVVDALRAATPEKPEVELEVQATIGQTFRTYRLTARTLWTREGEGIGSVGQLTEIGGEQRRGLIKDEDVTEKLQTFGEVFDAVQLVDPASGKVLALRDDGTLSHTSLSCCKAWRRDERCADCIAVRAYAEKAQLSRLEPIGSELRCMIAKYLEVGDESCVLELSAAVGDQTSGEGKRVRGRLAEQFYHDPLTGAYSRLYLESQQPYLEKAEGVAIIDADNFKAINDRYGHPVGDLALQCIARTILSCVRSSDILVRYGGDEFLLLFPKVAEDAFQTLMKRIQVAVHRATIVSHPEIQLDISIGGAYRVSPLPEAIRVADQRMYQAKHTDG